MNFMFSYLGAAFLFLNRKSSISILFSVEVLFFTIIFWMSSVFSLGGFFLLMSIIVMSATFSLAVFVSGLGTFSSESQQLFLDWGLITLSMFSLHLKGVLLAPSVCGTWPWSGQSFGAILMLFLMSLVFMCFPSIMTIWGSLLISSFIITSKIQQESSYSSMKYFIFQEIFSWGILMSLLSGNLALPAWGIVMKMGLPPFQGWLMSIINKMNKNVKWPLMASKIVPGAVAFLFMLTVSLPLLMIFSSMLFFSQALGMKEAMIMSSGFNISWALLSASEMMLFSLVFMLLYLGYIFYFLDLEGDNKPAKGLEYLIILGLPPSGFFFMKIYMISCLGFSYLGLLLLVLMLGFLLMIYLKIYELVAYSIFFSKSELFLEKGGWFTLFLFIIFLGICSL